MTKNQLPKRLDVHPKWETASTLLNLKQNEVHLWRIPLSFNTLKDEQFLTYLDEAELLRQQRFHFPEHRRRFLVSHAVTRLILSNYLKLAPKQLNYGYGKYNKPALTKEINSMQLQFNLTHSHELALLAVTLTNEIGVDVEHRQKQRMELELAKRYFSPIEYQQLQQLSDDQQLLGFYHTWTCKEAFIKALGVGLTYPLDKFVVSVDPAQPAKLIASENDQNVVQWTLETFCPANHYYSAVALKAKVDEFSYFDAENWVEHCL